MRLLGFEPKSFALKVRCVNRWHYRRFCLDRRCVSAFAFLHSSHRHPLCRYIVWVPCCRRGPLKSPASNDLSIWCSWHNSWHFLTSSRNRAFEYDQSLQILPDFVLLSIWSNSRASVEPHRTHFPPNSSRASVRRWWYRRSMYSLIYSFDDILATPSWNGYTYQTNNLKVHYCSTQKNWHYRIREWGNAPMKWTPTETRWNFYGAVVSSHSYKHSGVERHTPVVTFWNG